MIEINANNNNNLNNNNNNNVIIVYYARPKADYFPCYDDIDWDENWMVDTALSVSTGCLNDQGLFDSLLSAGLPEIQCEKVFDLAYKRGIELDAAESLWGGTGNKRPINKTTTQTFNDLNNDLIKNNIPVKFVCHWIF